MQRPTSIDELQSHSNEKMENTSALNSPAHISACTPFDEVSDNSELHHAQSQDSVGFYSLDSDSASSCQHLTVGGENGTDLKRNGSSKLSLRTYGHYAGFKSPSIRSPYSDVDETPCFEAYEYPLKLNNPYASAYESVALSSLFSDTDANDEFELAELAPNNQKSLTRKHSDTIESVDVGRELVPEGEFATFANETKSTDNEFTRASEARRKIRENHAHEIAVTTPLPETHSETLMSMRRGHEEHLRSVRETYHKKPLPLVPKADSNDSLPVAPDFRASRMLKEEEMKQFKNGLKQKKLPQTPQHSSLFEASDSYFPAVHGKKLHASEMPSISEVSEAGDKKNETIIYRVDGKQMSMPQMNLTQLANRQSDSSIELPPIKLVKRGSEQRTQQITEQRHPSGHATIVEGSSSPVQVGLQVPTATSRRSRPKIPSTNASNANMSTYVSSSLLGSYNARIIEARVTSRICSSASSYYGGLRPESSFPTSSSHISANYDLDDIDIDRLVKAARIGRKNTNRMKDPRGHIPPAPITGKLPKIMLTDADGGCSYVMGGDSTVASTSVITRTNSVATKQSHRSSCSSTRMYTTHLPVLEQDEQGLWVETLISHAFDMDDGEDSDDELVKHAPVQVSLWAKIKKACADLAFYIKYFGKVPVAANKKTSRTMKDSKKASNDENARASVVV